MTQTMTVLKEQRHMRLVVDFLVTIDETAIGDDKDWPERGDANHRLLHAIHANPKFLESLLKYLVSCELENLNWSKWYEHFLGNPSVDEVFDEIMHPIIPTLDQASQELVAGWEKDDVLFDNVCDLADGFLTCFQTDLAGVHLTANHKVEEGKS